MEIGWPRFVLAFALPVAAAAAWGTFAVPEDPSRSGKAPVPVPGLIRLGLELLILGGGAWALVAAGLPTLGWVLAGVTVVHYASSYDRIAWLLRR